MAIRLGSGSPVDIRVGSSQVNKVYRGTLTIWERVIASTNNLLRWSEEANNAAWVKSFVTVMQNTEQDMAGSSTLDTLNSSSINGVIRQNIAVTPNTQYTFSFEVKRGTMTNMKMCVYNFTAGADIIAPTSYFAQTSDSVTRLSFPFTTPAGCTEIGVYYLRDSGSTGTLHVGRAMINLGNTALTYNKTL